jgi:hypothetical protein
LGFFGMNIFLEINRYKNILMGFLDKDCLFFKRV